MPSHTFHEDRKNITLFNNEIRYRNHIIDIEGRIIRKVEPEKRVIRATVYEKDEEYSTTTVKREDRLNKNVLDQIREIFTQYEFNVPDTEHRLNEVLKQSREIIDESVVMDKKYNVQKSASEYWSEI